MKNFLAMAMAGLMFVLPSCAIGGQNNSELTEQQFSQVVQDTESAVTIGAIVLKKNLKEDARTALVLVASQAKAAIQAGGVSLPSSVDALLAQFDEQLAKAGVKQDDILLIRACVRLANSALGGVQLGLDGIGSERTKAVVLAILSGIELGLK
jgi:hypothetical protein